MTGKPPKKFQQRPKEVKEFEEEVIQIDRVTRVVKGGRRLRFRATVVIGDKKGRVGVGIGKSNEVTTAIKKASSQAQKNLINIPITKSDSIPHRIQVKFKSAKILLMPAGPGTGIIAGGAIRKVAELAGIKNLLSKAFGTTNRLSNAQAAIIALKGLTEIPELSKRFKKLESQQPPIKEELGQEPTPEKKPPKKKEEEKEEGIEEIKKKLINM